MGEEKEKKRKTHEIDIRITFKKKVEAQN